MWTVYKSPVGPLTIVANDEAIVAIEFADDPAAGPLPTSGKRAKERSAARDRGERDNTHPLLVQAAGELGEYFAGQRQQFDVPVAPQGSEFQREVWQALRDIPYGATSTYGELAASLGRTNAAARAVGTANGANPIPIIIPCHRVVGADGRLVGYAGGMARKEMLLQLENTAA